MVYIDTSALAKWYLNESKSQDFAIWIQTESDTRISTLTVVEMRCLLARRRRNRELSPAMERRVFATLQDDISQGFLIRHPVDDRQLNDALSLLEILADHPLRTLDAMHLSIANPSGRETLGDRGPGNDRRRASAGFSGHPI